MEATARRAEERRRRETRKVVVMAGLEERENEEGGLVVLKERRAVVGFGCSSSEDGDFVGRIECGFEFDWVPIFEIRGCLSVMKS